MRAPRAISPHQVNLERDIGLGKLMYATWFDNFNIVQFTILIVALIEGLIEHRLHKANRENACVILQRVWSWTVMVGLYPLCTAGVLVAGAYDETLGYLIIGIGLPLIVIVFVYSLRRLFYEGIRLRRKVAKDLSECDRASPAFPSGRSSSLRSTPLISTRRSAAAQGSDPMRRRPQAQRMTRAQMSELRGSSPETWSAGGSHPSSERARSDECVAAGPPCGTGDVAGPPQR